MTVTIFNMCPWTTKPVIRVSFKLSIDVWFVMIGQYLAEIQLFENLSLGLSVCMFYGKKPLKGSESC